MLTITDDVIKQVETLGKTQQQPFRASQMLQYKWIPGHVLSVDDANINVPDNEKTLLVPNPVEQQKITQDPNPISILANDEDIKNEVK